MQMSVADGLAIFRCAACGARYFPRRMICHRCGGHGFAEERAREGVVEEVSVIRHMLGQENWQPHRIASVRIGDDLRITVGLTDESGPGATIALSQEGLAAFGRAK
jgi:uncharacterized OB-fold protein